MKHPKRWRMNGGPEMTLREGIRQACRNSNLSKQTHHAPEKHGQVELVARPADPVDLGALYAQIPPMECKPGCHDCCGTVPAMDAERTRGAALDLQDDGLSCSQICPETGRCNIYESRPLICRIFGTAPGVSMLTCPHGCRPAPGSELAPDDAAAIMRAYTSDPNDMPRLTPEQEAKMIRLAEVLQAEAARLGEAGATMTPQEIARKMQSEGRLTIGR